MARMKPLYGNVKLYCTVVADSHIDIKNPTPWYPKLMLKRALKDCECTKPASDAFIIVGDTTSLGCKVNWDLTRDCFNKVKPKTKILFCIGNHDCWNEDGGFEAARKEYFSAVKDICGVERSRMYFSEVINGYSLIFLGNEADSGCGARISDEQIEWFKGEMAKGGESGKPIFVFCHQSINGRHGLPRTFDKSESDTGPMDGGVGEKSDEIDAVMHQYKNVFYFSGHSHMGFAGENKAKNENYSSFEVDGTVTYINLPSLSCGNHHGEVASNRSGSQLEVYEDKVVIRPRLHFSGSWLKKAIIKDGKPYFETKIK